MKKLIIILFYLILLNNCFAYAGDIIEDIYFKPTGETINKEIYVSYKGKEYLVHQYNDQADESYFSLQYYTPDETRIPKALMLIVNNNREVIREFKLTEYAPKFEIYDVDGNHYEDLILFWRTGMHSTDTEVWLRTGTEFTKVFEGFTSRGADFKTIKNTPFIVFGKGDAINQPTYIYSDEDYDFYKWDGKTFVLKNKNK